MSGSSERARRQAARDAERGQIPPPENSLQAIRDFIALWPLGPSVRIEKLDDHWIRGATIWALAHHAVQCAKAVLLLDGQQMHAQSAPIGRLIYECSMTAAWAAVTPFAGHALFAEAKHWHGLADRDLAKLAGQPPLEQAEVDDWAQYKPMAKNFQGRFHDLDNGLWMYGYYRLLSGWSHGNGSVLWMWLKISETPDPRYGHGMSFRGDSDFEWRNILLAIVVVSLNIALLAYDEVVEDHPLAHDLAVLAKRYNLRTKPFEQFRTQNPES